MTNQVVGYIRVSSIDQNPERQLQGIELNKRFVDMVSGSSTNRPQLKACMEYVREGDVLIVDSIDRLARNLRDLQDIINIVVTKGVIIRFVKEKLSFSGEHDPLSNLTLHLMGAFAEFERSMIRARQQEGIEAAKKAGKPLGRKPSITKKMKEQALDLIKQGTSIRKTAMTLKVSRPSIYKILEESNS